MAPSRIMFIRHAEKPHEPPCENDDGVKHSGAMDEEGLAVRGWQRAGALVHFFTSQSALSPDLIFAAGVGEGSPSHRPKQTVMPLAEWLGIKIHDSHLRDDIKPLINDVLGRAGVVLVSWEHHRILDIVAQLPHTPAAPANWPDGRFDIVWILDRVGDTWKFSQLPQMLLAGDREKLIA
jgi:broad specificity phosphatase PhoE